jgi:hypothetical protein
MPDMVPGWFQSFELGHQGYSEFLIYWTRTKIQQVLTTSTLNAKMNIRERFYPSLLGPHQPLYLTGQNTARITMMVIKDKG